MRSRLAVVSSLLVAGWIAACGGSDSSPETSIPAVDERHRRVDDHDARRLHSPRQLDRRLGGDRVRHDGDRSLRRAEVRRHPRMCTVRDRPGLHRPGQVLHPRPLRGLPHEHGLRRRRARLRAGRQPVPRLVQSATRPHSCKGDTPICDTTSGACVGCQTAATCPAGAPLCEPTTKTCVECTTNAQCPATRPHCFLGDFTCVECATSADCAGGKVCDPRERRCVATCTTDTQCTAPTPKCNTTTASCVQCLAMADCAGVAGPAALQHAARPLRPVPHATDCNADAGTPICDNDRCVQCKDDKDCPGLNPKCNNGTCK